MKIGMLIAVAVFWILSDPFCFALPGSDKDHFACAVAQDNRMKDVPKIRLSIEVAESVFVPAHGAEVSATINNLSDHPLELKAVGFNLSRNPDDEIAYHSGDSYISTFQLKDLGRITPGEPRKFKAKLHDLYWNDISSNTFDFGTPKNLFDDVPAGKYYVSMEVNFPASYSTPSDPRIITIRSNEIAITLKH